MTIYAIYFSNPKPLNFPIQGFLWETTKAVFFSQPFDLTTLKKIKCLIYTASIQIIMVPIPLAKVMCWNKLRIFNTDKR